MVIKTNGKEITLNEGQENALYSIGDFLQHQNPAYFLCLSGSAGSGKTTIIKEAIRGKFGIVVTAPTHKAKKVIKKVTGYESSTIQSLIGLKPDAQLEEFNQNNLVFTKQGDGKMGGYSIVVIDEASMLNKELALYIMAKAKEFRVKIIFMGDIRQLPPVGEKLSIVFTHEEVIQVKLNKVERQKEGNPLISLYSPILTRIDEIDEYDYNDTEHNIFKHKLLEAEPYEKIDNYNASGEGYGFLFHPRDFAESLIPNFKIGVDTDNKILAYTNAQVRKWNNFVRFSLLGDVRADLQVGEFLMAYRSVSDKKNWKILLTENSAEYQIKYIAKETFITEKHNNEEVMIFGNYVSLYDDETGMTNKIFVVKNDLQNHINFVKLENMKLEFPRNCAFSIRGYAWKLYYEFRNKFFLIGDICDASGNKLVKKDLDYAYALTVHKSQGSTYNQVFVDDSDISSKKELGERYRLRYVALSRPSHSSLILSSK